jgi:hypothetical protein
LILHITAALSVKRCICVWLEIHFVWREIRIG